MGEACRYKTRYGKFAEGALRLACCVFWRGRQPWGPGKRKERKELWSRRGDSSSFVVASCFVFFFSRAFRFAPLPQASGFFVGHCGRLYARRGARRDFQTRSGAEGCGMCVADWPKGKRYTLPSLPVPFPPPTRPSFPESGLSNTSCCGAPKNCHLFSSSISCHTTRTQHKADLPPSLCSHKGASHITKRMFCPSTTNRHGLSQGGAARQNTSDLAPLERVFFFCGSSPRVSVAMLSPIHDRQGSIGYL